MSAAAPALQRCRLMAWSAGRLVVASLFGLALGCSTPASPTDAEASPGGHSTAAEMISLTNAERRDAGLQPFAASPLLMRAAQVHAEQMAAHKQLSHVLPDARYPEPRDRLALVGYQWQAFAENVASGHEGAAAVVSAWMGSAGHRSNILNANLTELGAGYARDSSGRPYYVQVFGRPR